MSGATRHAEVIVVGGGQAGMAAGYYLSRAGIGFLILDAGSRAGEAWRQRWDTLELFTPARYSSLPGMRFPGSPGHYPGKDEVAGYLHAYARAFALPVRYNTRVTALEHAAGSYRLNTSAGTYEARAGDRRHRRLPAALDPADRHRARRRSHPAAQRRLP